MDKNRKCNSFTGSLVNVWALSTASFPIAQKNFVEFTMNHCNSNMDVRNQKEKDPIPSLVFFIVWWKKKVK